MKDTVRITFQPEDRSVFVLTGTTILEAAGREGIIMNMPCGGQGTCGKCRVEIVDGIENTETQPSTALSDEDVQKGFRLACQTKILGDVAVNVPTETRFFEQKILVTGKGKEVTLHPNIRKRFLKLPEPELDDQRSDLDRVLDAISDEVCGAWADIEVIREMPKRLRKEGFNVTVVVDDDEVVSVEKGDTSQKNYGVAFDVGTTTVVGMLVDLNTGKQLAVSSRANPQTVYGEDVVSRINYAAENKDGLNELQERIVACLNGIIAKLCQKAGISRSDIYEVTAAGNTTMNHILLKIDPHSIAQAPYVAVVRDAINTRARQLGLKINRNGNCYTMPNIAGFVGGDTVGVILASDLRNSDNITLAIDIGTNGEMVIGSKERLISCSTAAGPAFEGARIKYGMFAAEGAIEKVLINDDIEYNVIGNVPARGLCGTALIDTVAELLRVGIVNSAGKLCGPDEVAGEISDALRQRIVTGENGNDVILAHAKETYSGEPLVLTQRDVRELQLAKGAIFAGIQIMKKELGVSDDDIAEVLLAGAFGNFIRRSMAKRIGLLPDIPSERIMFIGNAAGAGARMVLCSRECREEAAVISRQTEYIELAGRADFQEEFMMAMTFPDPSSVLN